MAKKPNGTTQPPAEEEAQPQIGRENVSDETRREWYRECLLSKIGVEASQATTNTKRAEYRNKLKAAQKAGVDSAAISRTLAKRFQDEDTLVLEVREELRMLQLSGVVPDLLDKILARLDIQEPTKNERVQMTMDRCYDGGCFDGREGKPRDANPYPAGSEEYDTHDRGWLIGQAAIAAEMAPQPPAAVQ